MTDRIVRDGDTMLRWLEAELADVCHECGDAIWPGQWMAVYRDVYLDTKLRHVRRVFCGDCGKLLEDSMTTTEAR